MQVCRGSILVPVAVLMMICAVGAMFTAKYIHMVVEQSLQRSEFFASVYQMDEQLRNTSALLAIANHDVTRLPSDIASTITSQQAYETSGMSIVTTHVQSNSRLSSAFVAQHFVQYPWLGHIPVSGLTSVHDLFSLNEVPYQQHHRGDRLLSGKLDVNRVLETFFSVPDAVFDKAQLVSDCADLDALSSGAYLLNNDCILSPNQQIGRPDQPVLLILTNANLFMQHAGEIWGLIISRADSVHATYRISMSDSAIVSGAVVVDHKLSADSILNIAYSPAVLVALQQLPKMQIHQPISGTWRDF